MPKLFSLQGALRRIVYVSLYEALAIVIVTIVLLLVTAEGTISSSGLAASSSAIAVAWNLVFNWLFEQWERRQRVRGRSPFRRLAHAVGFEGGLLIWLVPFFAWWLGVSLWQALVMDVGFLLFFFCYTYLYAWGFDWLFGLPAAAAE